MNNHFKILPKQMFYSVRWGSLQRSPDP